MSSKRILTKRIQTADEKRHWIASTSLLAVIGCMCIMLSVTVFGKSLGVATSGQIQSTYVNWVVPVDENSMVNLDQRFANTFNSLFYIDKGKLSSKDIKSGKINWQSGKELRSAIFYTAGFLISGSQSNIFAFSPKNGKIIWQMKSKGSIKFFKSIDDNLIAFHTNSKFGISNHDIKTGKLLWNSSGYDYNLELTFFKQINNLLLIYGRLDGHILGEYSYCIDISTGKSLWKRVGKPVYTEKNIIITAENSQARWITGNLSLILHTLDYQNGLEIGKKILITVEVNDPPAIPSNSVDRLSQFNIWSDSEKLWIYASSGYVSVLENRDLDNVQLIKSKQEAVGSNEWIRAKNDKYSLAVKTLSGEVYGSDLTKPLFSAFKTENRIVNMIISGNRAFVFYTDGLVQYFDLSSNIFTGTSSIINNYWGFVNKMLKLTENTYIVFSSRKVGIFKI